MLPSSIRTRLLGLVFATTLPFAALIGVGLWNQWRDDQAAAIERALNDARLLAAQVDDHIGNLENLLTGLSRAVSINPADENANNTLLRHVKAELPDFIANILLFSTDGHAIGNSAEVVGQVYAGDRAYFQHALTEQRLVIGEIIHGRINDEWVIPVARPLQDKAGHVSGVLVIGTRLEHFQDVLRLRGLPVGSLVRIVSQDGIVISQSENGSNWIGRDLSESHSVMRHIAAGEASDIVLWSNNIQRITGSSTAHRVPWLVSVGVPLNVALAGVETRLRWSALFGLGAFVVASVIAWMLSSRIVRPLRQLGKDAATFAAGDLSHRTAVSTRDEVGGLADAFNHMAVSLERRQHEASRATEEVRQSKDALAAVIDASPAAIVVKDPADLTFILVNQAYERFMGVSRDKMMGKTVYELFPPEAAERIVEHDRAALQSENRTISAEFPVETPGNGLRIVTTTRLVVRVEHDEPQHLITVIEDVTERRKAEEKVAFMAKHDALTGLANRVQCSEQLKDALLQLHEGGRLAVLCLDLDHFKNINDTLGHAIGDELLVSVANRLRSCVRETDTIARLGGDEFAIIQTVLDEPQDAAALANRIQEVLKAPYDLGGLQAVTNVSIGISLAPAHATASDELMKQADMALYRAKAAGRGTYRFFEPEMGARMKARRSIESDLRNAIITGGLELHYQPVVNLADRAIVGLEALLRWRHPEHGMLSPAKFIPIAEESGLIIPLGQWVLQRACSDASKWPTHIKIAVNLSPTQFRDHNLRQVIVSTLAASGVAPRRLELEITEEVLLQDNNSTLALLHQLRELGIQIVMDDFGTGYSSLNYLRRFPLDKIKIDRSFIGSLSGENDVSFAIVRAVVGLAKVLNVKTTAEGVETDAQLELVRLAGCTEMQGYLFSPARPVEEISRLLLQCAGKTADAA